VLEKVPRLQKLWAADVVMKLHMDDHRYNWIHAKAPQAEALRQDLENLVAWAESAGLMDGELRGNLKAGPVNNSEPPETNCESPGIYPS